MSNPSTRDKILDAAESLFFNQGIATSSMDDVALSAGVAIATLYKHGGSKDELLRQVLERRLTQWTHYWDVSIAQASDQTETVLAIFDALTAFRKDTQETQWCCFLATIAQRPTNEDTSTPLRKLITKHEALLQSRLTEQVQGLTVTNPEDVSASIFILYNGALASILRGNPQGSIDRARNLARLVLS